MLLFCTVYHLEILSSNKLILNKLGWRVKLSLPVKRVPNKAKASTINMRSFKLRHPNASWDASSSLPQKKKYIVYTLRSENVLRDKFDCFSVERWFLSLFENMNGTYTLENRIGGHCCASYCQR